MSRWLYTLRQPRAWAALFGVAVVVVAGFSFSTQRAREVAPPPSAPSAPQPALSSFSDSYHKGTHTFSGALLVPTPCATLFASAIVDASTSPPRVRVDVSVSRDTGTCLQLPADKNFSVTAQAPAHAPVDVYINGTLAALPPATP